MTALAMDVRELSIQEIDDVGGGPLPAFVIAAAMAAPRVYQAAKIVGAVVGAGAAAVATWEAVDD